MCSDERSVQSAESFSMAIFSNISIPPSSVVDPDTDLDPVGY
jgi:hypothetical protein